ncbi:UDP-glucuronosyl/UDP-glucosyltransferase [Trinorchestia longiramus]|nr:UDP-glucuronosyl/UDP-glucosyltransferase [Trinorchestia longiramus]
MKNLFVKKWMPQQDILAHPNVKVFISHCGLLGIQEALHFGTPVLGMPLFGDQHKNSVMLDNAGVARILHWLDLNEKLLIDAIKELIENPSYTKKVMQVSAAMKDRPLSAVETAVYWTEYVVRHRGAVHLRSPARDLSWIEVLHVDLIIITYLLIRVLFNIVKRPFSYSFKTRSRKSKSEKKKKRE